MPDKPARYVCDQCGAPLNFDPSWHSNGEMWEHKCAHHHPQAGHLGSPIPRPTYEHIKELEGDLTDLIDAFSQLSAMYEALDEEIAGEPNFYETFVKTQQNAKPIIERWKRRKFGEDPHA